MILSIYLLGCFISLIVSSFVLYAICENKNYIVQFKRDMFVKYSWLIPVGTILSWLTLILIIFNILVNYLATKLFKS